MSKTLHKTARGLAALGRGEDKMLIHMTPREVEGLQALAMASGGSLTVNPKTGLLEAGWLSTLLPIVAGGAATLLSGGAAAPLWASMLAGAAGGGVGAKIEGEDPMMGALGGALGGSFGGSLTSGLMGAGQKAALGAAGQTAASNAAAAGMNAGQAAGQNIVGGAIQQGLNPAAANMAQAGMQNGVQSIAAQEAAKAAAANAAKTQIPAALANAAPAGTAVPQGMDAFKAGLGSLGQQGAVTELWKGMPNSAKLGAASTAMGVANASSSSSKKGKGDKPYYYHTSASIDPNGYVSFGPGAWDYNYDYERLGTYNPYDDSKYAIKRAEGGEVPAAEQRFTMPAPPPVTNPNPNQQYMQNLQQLLRQPPPMPSKPYQQELPPTAAQSLAKEIAAATKGKKGFGKILATAMTAKNLATAMTAKNRMNQPSQVRYTYDPVNGFTKLAGGGGISGLPEANSVPTAGRFIKGPGDGVSDSIPAMIDGQQPAALSNNEFVVDAMTMAKLGNGSPEAGAQRMYEWQQKVHSLPTAPGKDLKAHKYLPG